MKIVRKEPSRVKIERTEMRKVRPPLQNLPVFIINGLVLSYLGYDDEMRQLLKLLSCNGHFYLERHGNILRGFLVEQSDESKLKRIWQIAAQIG